MTDRLSNSRRITEKKPRVFEKGFYALIYAVSAVVLALVIYFVVVILARGAPAINWQFLSTASSAIRETIGILPGIVNTLYIIVFTLIISVPVGVGSAVYLNEYASNRRLVRVIEFATETLSGIPSIIYGVFGYTVFCLALNMKVSLLSGVLTLSIMVLPVMVRSTQEALKAVPERYREGALGLGAGKWHMIRTVLLPSSLKGILTGIILSIGRMVSESAALILVSGGLSNPKMPKTSVIEQLGSSGGTLSVELYRYATSRGDNQTAFGIAAVLMVIVILLNLLTRYITGKLNKNEV